MSGVGDQDGRVEAFFNAVVEATANGPYVATRTPKGFDVGLDVANRTWWTLLQIRHITQTSTQHVTFPAPDRYSVQEELHTITWDAGMPVLGVLHASFTNTKSFGTRIEFHHDAEYSPARGLTTGTDYTFQPQEIRRIIDDAARSVGFRAVLDIATRIGIAAAVVGGLIAVGGVVLAILLGSSG